MFGVLVVGVAGSRPSIVRKLLSRKFKRSDLASGSTPGRFKSGDQVTRNFNLLSGNAPRASFPFSLSRRERRLESRASQVFGNNPSQKSGISIPNALDSSSPRHNPDCFKRKYELDAGREQNLNFLRWVGACPSWAYRRKRSLSFYEEDLWGVFRTVGIRVSRSGGSSQPRGSE